MRHWPFSVIKNSPLAPAWAAWELYQFPSTRNMSLAAADACAFVARDTQPIEEPRLAMLHSVDAPPMLAYLGRPIRPEFARLEAQGVVFENDEYFLFSVTRQ